MSRPSPPAHPRLVPVPRGRRLPQGRFVVLAISVAGTALVPAVATAPAGAPHTLAAEVATTSPPHTLGETSAPDVRRARATTLDEQGIFFVSYDGVINANSFQQDALLTHGDTQFAAWYTADRSAVLARRDVSRSGRPGPWRTTVLSHRLSSDDSHNTISLGVSAVDGRLHVAMDTHNTQVFYLVSREGLADEPAERPWRADDLGPVQRTLGGADLGSITYPRFVPTPDGQLQLSYRTGGSGQGTVELAEYDDGQWSLLGGWSSPDGEYAANGGTSASRNMYLHGIQYGPDGRLHATYTWREDAVGGAVLCDPGGLSNHDTAYVYSDDRGRTWRTQDGAVAALTGTDQRVSVDTPGAVVDPLGVDRALINQESQAVDSRGRVHVVISYVPAEEASCVTDFTQQRRDLGRTFHLVQQEDGTWRKTELPEPLDAFGRSALVLTDDDDAVVVMPRGRVLTASSSTGWQDWALREDGTGLDAFGEVLVDRERLLSDDVLSVMYQEDSTGRTPSPVRVLDLRVVD